MEFVFVVPRTALFPESYPHGLVPFGDAPRAAVPGSNAANLHAAGFEALVEREGFFVERAYAERSPALKQVIPYSIVCCETDRGSWILCTRRLKKGGEARLHELSSIGIGGHINPEDLPASGPRNPLDAGTRREIAEELVVRGPYEVRRVGLLNDDSNPVGAVHVGLVQVVTVTSPVEIRERDTLEGRLVTVEELQRLNSGGTAFETWSKLLIPHLASLTAQPLAART